MGPLGGGDGTSGWGVMPPPMSSNDWGSSSGNGSSSSSVTVNSGPNATSSGVNHWQSSSSSSIVSGPLGASVSNNSSTIAAAAAASNANNMNQSVSSSVCRIQQSNSSNNSTQSGPGELSTSPKLSSSWAQAAGKGLGLSSSSNPSATGILHSQQSNPISHDASSSQQSSQQPQTSQQCQSQAILGSNVSSVGGVGGMSVNSASHNPNGPSLVMNNPNDAISNQSSSTSTMLGGNNAGGSHHATSNPIDVALPASHKTAWSSINKQGSVSSSSIADVVGHVTEELRQTLLTDNWTNSVINHDSPWDIAPSPLSSPKDSSTWRCPAKAGTEIWENNVRQKKGGIHQTGGGHQLPGPIGNSGNLGMNSVSTGVGGGNGTGMPSQGGPNTGMSQPWQAPSSNIVGTWGEEEDTSNHWNPVQTPTNAPMAVGSVGPGSNQVSSGGIGMNGMSGLGSGNYSSINNTWSGSAPMVNGASQSGQPSAGTSNYPLLPPGGGGNGGNNFVSNNSNISWNAGEKTFNEPRNKNANWGNFDESNEQQWENKNNTESSFGTWNPEPKRDSWDKDSNESYKGADDGTSGWGNTVRPKPNTNPSTNWKPEQNKYGNNNNNNNNNSNNNNNGNKNPSNGFNQPGGNGGWNNSANNNPSNNNKNYMMQRSWTNDGGNMHKSQQMWNQGTRSPNGSNNWADGQIDTSQWGDNRQKPLSREMIQTSKQYRALLDQGFKANQVESALRNQNMSYDGATAELKAIHEYGMKNMNQGFNNGAMRTNKANSFGGSSLYNQYGQQQQHQGNSQGQSVKQMIDRIQNAVNAGYLNAQILNQSLSSQDLELVSELLYKINELQQFQNDHAYAQVHGGSKKEMDEKVNQMKIAISNLQTRLTMGPMVNMKSLDMNTSNQQSAPGPAFGPGNGPSSGPQAGNGYPMPGAGSRFHQWTKKNNQQQPNEFARAPGPSITKQNQGDWGFDNVPLVGSQWNQEFSIGKPEKHMLDDYQINSFQSADQFSDHKWKPSPFGKGLTEEVVDPRSPISNPMIKQDSIFPTQSWSGARGQSSKSFNNPQPQIDPFSFDSNAGSLWSFNSNSNGNAQANMMSQQQQMFDMPKKNMNKPVGGGVVGGAASGWNAQGINTGADFGANEPSLWGSVPGGSKPRAPPPGLSKNQSIWNSNTPVNDYGMGMPRGMAPQVDYNY